ncbi:zeta toxin family protein [Paracoccaceae bacterium Fryx2]|nr:zeta toxin family protein [Paracoccaceae bacterium Fryx2]
MSPTLILLAGPNGSGKSTLYRTRVAPAFAGAFINADIIQREELGDDSPEAAYSAAGIATQRRNEILSRGGDFATETVFSHPSKLDLVNEARARGYTVWVMHVGVDSPDLSVARVAHRVGTGGHGVPEGKIRERYARSAPLVRAAVRLAETGLVYDNSVAGQHPEACPDIRKRAPYPGQAQSSGLDREDLR